MGCSTFTVCLDALVTDDKEMCRAAVKSGSLANLSILIKAITPTGAFQDWGDGEPESKSRLREVTDPTRKTGGAYSRFLGSSNSNRSVDSVR